jgi:protein-disulfide isomerase
LTVRALAATALVLASLAGCGGGDDGGGGDGSPPEAGEKALRGEASLDERFRGIPQDGAILGRRDAPYTLVEFADLQCPFCAQFDRAILPAVIERFVRPGRLRLEFRAVAFLGPDSGEGAAATVAAGRQDRMWQFADLFYRNQGAENSGYVTPAFLARVARGAGLDLERWRGESNSPELVADLEANARAARTARIPGTPSFRLGRTGGVLPVFDDSGAGPAEFVRRLEAAIR